MKKILGVSAAIAMGVAFASPALAQTHSVVVLAPGSSSGWVQRQPTMFLNTDMAQVLPDGQAYIAAGGGLGLTGLGLPGGAFSYMRGLGGGSEYGVGLGLAYTNPGAFGAAIGGSWKTQLSRGGATAIAFNVGAGVSGIGSGATMIGGQLGLPISIDAGAGHLVVDPRVRFPSLVGGGGATAGSVFEASLGYMGPFANNWQFMVDATPGFGLAGQGFAGVPVGLGARFSPTDSSHVDFTVGQVGLGGAATTVGIGLVGVNAYVGW